MHVLERKKLKLLQIVVVTGFGPGKLLIYQTFKMFSRATFNIKIEDKKINKQTNNQIYQTRINISNRQIIYSNQHVSAGGTSASYPKHVFRNYGEIL